MLGKEWQYFTGAALQGVADGSGQLGPEVNVFEQHDVDLFLAQRQSFHGLDRVPEMVATMERVSTPAVW